MKTCPNCSTQLRDEAKFCYNCGQKVFVEKPRLIFCEECGAQIEITAQKCPFCGVPVILPESELAGKPANMAKETISPDKPVAYPVAVSQFPTRDGDNAKVEKITEGKLVNAIICSQCGSTSVKMETETVGRCLHCGATIALDNRPQKVINHVNVVGEKRSTSVGFFKVKKDKSEKQFQVDAFKTLANHDYTPLDIFEYTYLPVTEEEKHLVAYRGDVHLTYSAQVGIDRTIEYMENGQRKTKKVTDWHPVSGMYEGNFSVGLPEGDLTYEESIEDENLYADYYEHATDTAKSIEEFDGEGIVITQKNQEVAKERLKGKAASACKGGITGDHVRDFNYSATVDLQEIRGYIIPQYTMQYKKNEKSENMFFASAYAAGDDMVYGNCPDDTRNINADTTISNLKFTIPAILLFIATCVVSLVVDNLVIAYVMLIASIGYFIFSVLIPKVLRKKVIAKNKEIKNKRLESFLRQKGFAE